MAALGDIGDERAINPISLVPIDDEFIKEMVLETIEKINSRHAGNEIAKNEGGKMAKWDPLREYLRKPALEGQEEVILSFSNIEKINGFPLGRAAHNYRQFWENDRAITRSQARSWLDAGWRVVMADSETENVKFQRIVQKKERPNRGTVNPLTLPSFTNKCPYCKGEGKIQDFIYGPRDCPVNGCKGGWLNLDGSPDDYKPCGPCKGTGKEGDDIFGWKPCHFCYGSGLVKVR